MWHDLYASCEIPEVPCEGYRFAPKPSPDTLDAFESKYGVKLPRSYREFVLLFGAGELAGFYRIAAPMEIADIYELAQFNSDSHGRPEEQLLESYGLGENIKKFLFFCDTIGGEFFGWKNDEVTESNAHEYAVYRFPRSCKVDHVADTFAGFIEQYALVPDASQHWTPILKFTPFVVKK